MDVPPSPKFHAQLEMVPELATEISVKWVRVPRQAFVKLNLAAGAGLISISLRMVSLQLFTLVTTSRTVSVPEVLKIC